jgi:glycosyltransferase involved in cell wall biosynthesis
VHVAIGYCASKFEVIPNGFELDNFVPCEAARFSVRAELNLPTDALLVGLVARFDRQKNHFGFIEAASRIHQSMPNVHFVLVGQDVDDANAPLCEAIAARGLQSWMHLLGRRDDVPRLMASFDVLASSSNGEAFPNVLGEAMACGVPCVATNAGDSGEIIAATGRVVPVGDMKGLSDALLEILQLPEMDRVALGAAARDRVVEHYDIARVVLSYEAVYAEVLEDAHRRSA